VNHFDRSKSLQELEGQDWGDPTYNSHLVTECHRLRRVPLQDFSAGNLRIMMGQQIGLPYLIPLAIECLRDDPLLEAEFYCGDLLVSTLKVDPQFWLAYSEYYPLVQKIASQAILSLPSLDETDRKFSEDALRNAYSIFVGHT
jgi:hypothetical protein